MRISESIFQYSIKHPVIGIAGDNVNNGCYLIPHKTYFLFVIAASGQGWDHVSITIMGAKNKRINRTPNWNEMSCIKDLFFDEKETVVQFHPPKSHHVNNHPYCLHLWRDQKRTPELPPLFMV